jgi:glycosyltransferase involved in cell wall biosynthesis
MMHVLHILSQRPSQTGSGVTLQALLQYGQEQGYVQAAVVAAAKGEAKPEIEALPPELVFPLYFEQGPLNFPIPGMSDVMPYKSTRFSEMHGEHIDAYKKAWANLLREVKAQFKPDVIHSNHLWILSAMLKDIFPEIPIVTHCHATGLRQMELCPDLKKAVQQGCARNNLFAVLHEEHAALVEKNLGVDRQRIHVVGAGYMDNIFHNKNAERNPNHKRILYAGKYAHAKGVPYLLDAFERLAQKDAHLSLDIAGSGSGDEAQKLRERMQTMAPNVHMHGQVNQRELAELMRRADVFVLPSMYEGLPLVLVEAFACGCRLVATDLTGIREQIAPYLKDAIYLVPKPKMQSVDQPSEDAVGPFKVQLTHAIEQALLGGAINPAKATFKQSLEHFKWQTVSTRIDHMWKSLL